MVSGFINENPVIYERKERYDRPARRINDHDAERLDPLEVFEHLRDIKDPEYPYTLEQLNVVSEGAIEVIEARRLVRVKFTPTVDHCSMATVIGLCLRVKLMRTLPSQYKVDITVAPGTHATEDAAE
ncbi:unnamed protein product [Victoria cruziana]